MTLLERLAKYEARRAVEMHAAFRGAVEPITKAFFFNQRNNAIANSRAARKQQKHK